MGRGIGSVKRSGLTARVSVLAIAGGFATAKETPQEADGATDTGIDPDRFGGAVTLAGSAFHAPVAVNDTRLAVFHPKNLVRADGSAHPAADTLGGIELKCHNIR